MFDDFNYTSPDDPELATFNKWNVIDGPNGPPAGAQYAKSNIQFVDDSILANNRIIELSTQVNGQQRTSTQARIETDGFEYFEGTYAARVYFDETPFTYGDANIQTFYTIVSWLLGGDGSKYSELDFEYMASDKWGIDADKQVMYLTAWNRYIAEPWQAWKDYIADKKSWKGWHTCVVSCTDGVNVKYWIDGQYFGALSVTDNDGTSVYPRNPMQVAFANWIWNNVIGSSTANRTTTMKVDWTIFFKDQEKTPQEVDNQVALYRSQGVQRKNLLGQEHIVPVTNFKLDGSVSIAGKCVTINGLYVDGLNAKLGNSSEENKILEFAKNNGFNYLLIYELHLIMPNAVKQNQLAAFIKRAKTLYGIDQVAAIVESANGIQTYVDYNNARDTTEKFDVFNLEFEFWSTNLSGLGYCGYLTSYGACNRTIAFNFYIDQIKNLEAAATPIGVETEVYIGWPTEAEATAIANEVDRVLVHYYRPNDIGIINYGIERLRGLAAANKKIRVAPIFSSEGTGNTADIPFMGDWLATNPIDKAFESWDTQYNSLTDSWKSNLEIIGSTWFTYGRFIQNQSSHITTQPTDVVTCTVTTKSFSVESSSANKKFYWTKNGKCLEDGGNISGTKSGLLNISNITNADTGTYRCRVISFDSNNPSSYVSNEVRLLITNNCTVVQLPFNSSPLVIPGTIECEEYDFGGEGVSYHEVNPLREGANTTFRPNDGVDIEVCSEGGYSIGYFEPTEWLEYTVNCTKTDIYQVDFRVSTDLNAAKFHLEIDGVDVTNSVVLSSTGGWQNWSTYTVNGISIAQGNHVLRLYMEEQSINFNYLLFKPDVITSAADLNEDELVFYPNPIAGDNVIYCSTILQKALLYNFNGGLIKSLENTQKVDLQDLASGVYFLRTNGKVYRLVKI